MSEAVSVIVDRQVLPGYKKQFEELLKGIILASSKFEGYIDTFVEEPKAADDHRYQILFQFNSLENLEKWKISEERLSFIEKIDQLIDKPTNLQVITGLETWFCLPGTKTITPPPRYKMAMVTWLAITPLLILFNWSLGPLLSPLPLVPRILCSTPFIVAIMTYLWMPFMTKLFRGWLYPKVN